VRAAANETHRKAGRTAAAESESIWVWGIHCKDGGRRTETNQNNDKANTEVVKIERKRQNSPDLITISVSFDFIHHFMKCFMGC
jgi:hypothetical protein